jgi:hypothetical protein
VALSGIVLVGGGITSCLIQEASESATEVNKTAIFNNLIAKLFFQV